ncbi:Hypothetical protein PHPALM_20176 [Phytophthora palmivora]|uniref:Transmembrane protein n=1 Tax=Phytophthora palmivora TaxID=4796 RepID=A0A2P4XFL2_9STRA|nr:Hypothetical protein PHPALM_20176 [Phytophthora palmivora]
MTLEITSQDVVMVPGWAFTMWWLVFLAVHLATCGYNMGYAFFYWWLGSTRISQYLVFYRVGMPPDYYRSIATIYFVLSSIHALCILLMVGSSMWLRKFAFTPWREFTKRQNLNDNKVIIKVKMLTRNPSRVNAAIIKGVSTVKAQITNRYGIMGVNGKYFHVILICRELVETTLQTIQAYRMSRLLPSILLNRFYVIGLVLNCWSPVILHALFFQRDEARKRFACLVSDCVLNLLPCMGVTFIVVLSYLGQYDSATTDFGDNPWYNDEWAARALNEFQMVLVMSWSDLASRAIFSLGLLLTTSNMKELLYLDPRSGNRVVAFSDKSLEMPRRLEVKSSLKPPDLPSVRLLPKNDAGKHNIQILQTCSGIHNARNTCIILRMGRFHTELAHPIFHTSFVTTMHITSKALGSIKANLLLSVSRLSSVGHIWAARRN